MKYYDQINNQLVYEEEKSTSTFWDNHWKCEDIKKEILKGKNDVFVSRITKKFIAPSENKKILEGGCGKGNYVYSLNYHGYDVQGIDYAENTVKSINEVMPKLKIKCGNVENLDFPNNYFDGYWSLGVIEHFYYGYDTIIKEMKRVLKSDGYGFITFPHLSLLRKLKIKYRKYLLFDKKIFNENRFYQFAFDSKKVSLDLEKNNLEIILKKQLDGFKGLMEEISNSHIKKILCYIYNSNNLLLRFTKFSLSILLTPFCGHIILIVVKNK